MSPEDPNAKTPDAKPASGQHPPSADDVLDLGHLPAADGGSASLSQSSGPLSGTPVVAWTDLLRTRTLGEINLDLEGVEIDAESDRDLIERILAEGKAASGGSSRPKTEEFIDLGGAGSGSGSNVLGGAEPPGSRSSEVNLQSPPPSEFELFTADRGDDSSAAEIGNSPSHVATSSAVNLGSESVIDLPGPAGSSYPRSDPAGKVTAARADDGADSDVVDLLSAGRRAVRDERGDRTPVAVVTRADAHRPASGSGRFRDQMKERPWSVAAASGLAGAILTGAVWLTSGALSAGPKDRLAPADHGAAAPFAEQLRAAGLDVDAAADPGAAVRQFVQQSRNRDAEVKMIEAKLEGLRDALRKAKLDPADPGAVSKLVKSKETAEKARRDAEKSLQTSTVLLKEADEKTERLDAELKAVREQLAAVAKAPPPAVEAKPAPPAAPASESAEVARLRDERQRLEARAKELEARAESATTDAERLRATLKEQGGFAAAVRQRLRTAPNARPDEVLAALDRSLTPAAARSDLPSVPRLAYDPAAERAFARGLSDYFAGRLTGAEANLRAATGLNNLDARYWYYLGLSRLAQGNEAQAEQDFRQGAERERRNLPNPGAIDACLERLPSDARQAINRYRGR